MILSEHRSDIVEVMICIDDVPANALGELIHAVCFFGSRCRIEQEETGLWLTVQTDAEHEMDLADSIAWMNETFLKD